MMQCYLCDTCGEAEFIGADDLEHPRDGISFLCSKPDCPGRLKASNDAEWDEPSLEESAKCAMCGKPVIGRRVKYCSASCSLHSAYMKKYGREQKEESAADAPNHCSRCGRNYNTSRTGPIDLYEDQYRAVASVRCDCGNIIRFSCQWGPVPLSRLRVVCGACKRVYEAEWTFKPEKRAMADYKAGIR